MIQRMRVSPAMKPGAQLSTQPRRFASCRIACLSAARPVLAAFFAIFALSGCFWKSKEFVIPEMPSAREQYDVAYTSYRKAEGVIVKTDQRKDAITEAETAFKMVISRFPNDVGFTPRADLMLGRCQMLREDFGKAANQYRTILERYPDNKEIQAVGLYELGLALDGDKQYAEAKKAYRQMIERFSSEKDTVIQDYLSLARRRYRAIHAE